ncbi:hypothetical protein NUU61_005034 [Penicillium alfredii]|uniref:Uncharacterized protein n=1 Tax=Penicillium alfredii TaxID=1506179 RepID=A0A9W9F8T3_9EURO|nr:uncharacterized protein NUU61_005034 [Penicillium alfredii]KAJ5095678.1 hypothetical protein NUU61_005034 [Penicillium alfredii]
MIGLHSLCAVMFTVGFALREYSSYHYLDQGNALIIYIMSQVFINICPPLLELSNYHVLGRMFSYLPHLAPIPPSRVLGIFGALMGLVEALNSLGVAFSSNPKGNEQTLGKALTLVALSIQLCVILSFLTMATIFHRRCSKAPIPRQRGVPTLMFTLYISMVLILIRCIYRMVEHAGNSTVNLDSPKELQSLSPIYLYEWYFYVFEAALMLLNSWLWNVWHPGRFLPQDSTVFLGTDGQTEWADPSKKQAGLAQVGYMVMQWLTFGLWGQFFGPQTRANAELGKEDSGDRV